MKANDPEPPAGRRSWRIMLIAADRFVRRLPIPLFLALSFGATLAWIAFLAWAAFSLLLLLIG